MQMPELYEVTVNSGEDILRTISDFVTAHGWQNVMIPAAIGSVIGMEFTTPIRNELPLRTSVTPFHNAAELLSFTGEIMTREKLLKAVVFALTVLLTRAEQCFWLRLRAYLTLI